MLAVDTNVLIRALVDDPDQPAQVGAAKAVIKRAGEVFISQIVQVETVWVLEAVYGLKRNDIVMVLDTLTIMGRLDRSRSFYCNYLHHEAHEAHEAHKGFTGQSF